MFSKNQNFLQKSKSSTKIELLSKNQNSVKKSKFLLKIKILYKNRNFAQKSKFFTEIDVCITEKLTENCNFGETLKFCQK